MVPGDAQIVVMGGDAQIFNVVNKEKVVIIPMYMMCLDGNICCLHKLRIVSRWKHPLPFTSLGLMSLDSMSQL